MPTVILVFFVLIFVLFDVLFTQRLRCDLETLGNCKAYIYEVFAERDNHVSLPVAHGSVLGGACVVMCFCRF